MNDPRRDPTSPQYSESFAALALPPSHPDARIAAIIDEVEADVEKEEAARAAARLPPEVVDLDALVERVALRVLAKLVTSKGPASEG